MGLKVGLIMDGNRTYHKERGHEYGYNNLRTLTNHNFRNRDDVDEMYDWSLSEKNREKRSFTELGGLYTLAHKGIKEVGGDLQKGQINFSRIGSVNGLPQKLIYNLLGLQEHNFFPKSKKHVMLLLNYDGDSEYRRSEERVKQHLVKKYKLDRNDVKARDYVDVLRNTEYRDLRISDIQQKHIERRQKIHQQDISDSELLPLLDSTHVDGVIRTKTGKGADPFKTSGAFKVENNAIRSTTPTLFPELTPQEYDERIEYIHQNLPKLNKGA